ncbi:rhodanese-like domain-containing protein [Kribbia dieselivorans]|uniref:rhodanese-like domain-containing protein n=1 Tax=Kribbia dieselivorans TaxID=331526 RepID=UPI0012ED6851|nr:rhodanese-like domain-containing protein [Kribbia dieselivorans]
MTEMGLQAPTDLPDDAVMIDVRERDEWDAGHAPQAIHIPLGDLPARLGELPETEPLPLICRSGGRSGRAGQWLAAQGYDVVNVDGGMKQWAADGKTVVSENGGPGVVI